MSSNRIRKLKVGFFVQRVAGAIGYERNVSAHVQIPAKCMSLLRDSGCDVELVTTEYGANRTLPDCLPEGIVVHKVPYGTRQGDDLVMHTGRKSGVKPLRLFSQISALKRLAVEREFDLYHLSGGEGIASLGGLVSASGLKIPIVASLNTGEIGKRSSRLNKFLWKRLAKVITTTDYFHRKCSEAGMNAVTLRHGAIKEISPTTKGSDERSRVLFWRDPSRENGADLCVEAFKLLAPKYPNFSFDFALRPYWDSVGGIREFVANVNNAKLFEFPYEGGISIDKLMQGAICIVLPFRELSTNPQLAVVESMLSGIATVTTDVESNSELIEDMRTGVIVKTGDVDSIVKAVDFLLNDPAEAQRIGEAGRLGIAKVWTWDGYLEGLLAVYESALGRKIQF